MRPPLFWTVLSARFAFLSAWEARMGMLRAVFKAGSVSREITIHGISRLFTEQTDRTHCTGLLRGTLSGTTTCMRHLIRVDLASIRPEWCPSPTRTSPAPGALWPVSTWERPPHDAGWPRYTQARAPHARGWVLLKTGTTREASIENPVINRVAPPVGVPLPLLAELLAATAPVPTSDDDCVEIFPCK